MDGIFLITVLPEIPAPVCALREISDVIKPGGIVSTTEELLEPDYPRQSTTITWAEAVVIELVGSFVNWWNYALNFQRMS